MSDALPRHCTNCDYDLAGLPDDAVCPECGAAVDRRFVVLRGHAVGGSATPGSTTASRAFFSIAVVTGLQLFNWVPGLIADVRRGAGWSVFVDVAWIAFIFAIITAGLWRRFGDASAPPAQLWLGEAGYLIRGRRDREQSRATRRRASPRTASVVWTTIGVSAGVALLVAVAIRSADVAETLVALLAIVFAFVAVAWLIHRARRRQPATINVVSTERPLTLIAWQADTAVTFTSAAKMPATVAIRINVFAGPLGRRWEARVERFLTPLSDAQCIALIARVDAWLAAATVSGNDREPEAAHEDVATDSADR